MRRLWITILTSALALGTAACGSAQPRPPAEPATATSPRPVQPASSTVARSSATAAPRSCAGRTPDTKVGAQLLDTGAALVFTTREDIATLRRRAADVTVPEPLQSAGPRIDNIQHGVRLIFDAGPSTDPKALHEEVVEHARQVAKQCGIVLDAPSDATAAAVAARRAAQERRPESSPKSSGKSSPKTVSTKPKPKDSDGSAAKPPAKGAPKSESKRTTKDDAKPKPSDKGKDANKPKIERKPNDGVKPPLPPLPGPRPDPIWP